MAGIPTLIIRGSEVMVKIGNYGFRICIPPYNNPSRGQLGLSMPLPSEIKPNNKCRALVICLGNQCVVTGHYLLHVPSCTTEDFRFMPEKVLRKRHMSRMYTPSPRSSTPTCPTPSPLVVRIEDWCMTRLGISVWRQRLLYELIVSLMYSVTFGFACSTRLPCPYLDERLE